MGATTPLGRVELFELRSRRLDHGSTQGPRYGMSEHREPNVLQAERAKKIHYSNEVKGARNCPW